MNWHKSFFVLLIFIASVLTLGICATYSQADDRPNIIFILADDLGYGDVGCYNSESKIPTPNLDRLARQGMRFTDAHSPSTVCTSSRYGLLTGRLFFRTGITGVLTGVDGPLIEPNRRTVAHFLKKEGYATACVGKWHVGMTFFDQNGTPVGKRGGGIDKVKQVDWSKPIKHGPNDAGFDYFYGTACCPTTDWLYAYIENDRVTSIPREIVKPETKHWLEYEHFRTGLKSDDFDFRQVDLVFLEKSKAFIEKQTRERPDQPFFLYHCTQSAHLPAMPAPRFVDKSRAGPLGDFIFEFDHVVGQLLETLDKNGIADNTLVVVSSDNGPEIIITDVRNDFAHDSARPWRGMKRDNWEGGHRVPLIARWPAVIKPGSNCEASVSLTDFFATCAAVVDKPLGDSEAEDSLSFLPLLRGETPNPPIREFTLHHTMNNSLGIRKANWKLLAHRGSGGNNYESPRLKPYALNDNDPDVPMQLYDLEKDPGETENLFEKNADQARTLKSLLDKAISSGRSR